VSDYVMVLYKGHVAEAGPPKEVIGDPQHPYTRLLIDSIPWPELDRDWGSYEEARAALDKLDEIAARPDTVYRGGVTGFELSQG
jgi:peptide/nickel transport system ATP-binding protein